MLGTPGFLAELIDRLLAIAEKVQSNAAYKMLIAGVARGDRAEQIQTAGTAAKSNLLTFQLQMYDLEDLFANPDQTEFMIVTVPTELAVRESVRYVMMGYCFQDMKNNFFALFPFFTFLFQTLIIYQ